MKSSSRMIAMLVASLTTFALALPLTACGARRGDPTTPERSWSTSHLPVQYGQEAPDARNDLTQEDHLFDEHGVQWFHYAPTTDGGLRVFFPDAQGCSYRLIVRETMQYVGVAVVEGGTADDGCLAGAGDRTTERYASMHADLTSPLANRKAVELADLVATAVDPKSVGDGPKLDSLATDASAIPEVLWGMHPELDMLFLDGAAYVASTDDESAAIAARIEGSPLIGNVGRTVTSGDFLRDWDATQLPPGTKVYQSPEDPTILYAMSGSGARQYRMAVEG